VSENLELVRSIYARFDSDEYDPTGWAKPDIEFVIADGPEPVNLRGTTAVKAWLRDFLSAWEGLRVVVDEYRELDDGRVLALVRSNAGRARTSGLVLGQHGGAGLTLYEMRAGKVMRGVHYFNRERALTDLGLEE
jgi:ketosteroid isomerase-like protein